MEIEKKLYGVCIDDERCQRLHFYQHGEIVVVVINTTIFDISPSSWFQYERVEEVIELFDGVKIKGFYVKSGEKETNENNVKKMMRQMDTRRQLMNKDKYFTYVDCYKCQKTQVGVYVPMWDEEGCSVFRQGQYVSFSPFCNDCRKSSS
jgi:hypothetical protein